MHTALRWQPDPQRRWPDPDNWKVASCRDLLALTALAAIIGVGTHKLACPLVVHDEFVQIRLRAAAGCAAVLPARQLERGIPEARALAAGGRRDGPEPVRAAGS